VITELEKQMKQAAKDLEFEKAALLRDEIFDIRSILGGRSRYSSLEESSFIEW